MLDMVIESNRRDEEPQKAVAEDAPLERRAAAAVDLVLRYGGVDGKHHQDWLQDQVVRLLMGEEYEDFVDFARRGEDGSSEYAYEWETGVAP